MTRPGIVSRLIRKCRSKPEPAKENSDGAVGFMAFQHTGQVVAARKALLAAGLTPQVKAPPPSLREGCDMVLEFPAVERSVYLAVLEEKGLRPLKIASSDGLLTAPESLFRHTRFPDHLMVSAANMKLTIENQSGRIVNVSGGGCPDVPALAACLLGQKITKADSPEELSRSLCSFTLTQARDEAERCFRKQTTSGPASISPAPPASKPMPRAPWPKKKNAPRPRPWLIVGTLADPEAPLGESDFIYKYGKIIWNGQSIAPERGTAALLAAYAVAAEALGLPPGRAVLAGDRGDGQGSRKVYAWLLEHIAAFKNQAGETSGNSDRAGAQTPSAELKLPPAKGWSGLTFHYLFPLAELHDRIFMALDELEPRPVLAADAGFMYVAKLCGQAPEYDLFTPDAGEMAYLADPLAPHPFYTRGALLQKEEVDEAGFAAAHREGNAAESMLVKGRRDKIIWRGHCIHRVEAPDLAALEAIGGTGDTATGLASAFMAAGFSPIRSAALAAHLNRRAGCSAGLNPGSSIAELISALPEVIEREIKSSGY